ncbi:MAG: hypothetical protein ACI84D_000227 [Thalassolituus oleivorans]
MDGAETRFSVYGYLDTAADTQFVRLESVRQTGVGARPSLEDVIVRSTDGSGEWRLWEHRAITLDDGARGDLFFGVFRPEANQHYQVEAEASNGDVTRATVSTPPIPEIVPGPPLGNAISLTQHIEVSGLTLDPLRLTLLYAVREPDASQAEQVIVDYGTGGIRIPQGWAFDVFLTRDHSAVLVGLGRNAADRDVALESIGVRTDILSPEWAHPRTSDNITSGRGFFGAIGRYELYWVLETDAVLTMGFVDGQ